MYFFDEANAFEAGTSSTRIRKAEPDILSSTTGLNKAQHQKVHPCTFLTKRMLLKPVLQVRAFAKLSRTSCPSEMGR